MCSFCWGRAARALHGIDVIYSPPPTTTHRFKIYGYNTFPAGETKVRLRPGCVVIARFENFPAAVPLAGNMKAGRSETGGAQGACQLLPSIAMTGWATTSESKIFQAATRSLTSETFKSDLRLSKHAETTKGQARGNRLICEPSTARHPRFRRPARNEPVIRAARRRLREIDAY